MSKAQQKNKFMKRTVHSTSNNAHTKTNGILNTNICWVDDTPQKWIAS